MELFYTDTEGERTVKQFEELGFSIDDAEKVYIQPADKELLLLLYKKVNGLEGTSENPHNVMKWLKDRRLRHYTYRDGAVVGLYSGFQWIYNQTVCCGRSVPCAAEVCAIGDTVLQRGDIYIGVALATLQLSSYLLQWWYGDITFKQLVKSGFVGCSSIGVGLAVTFLTLALGPEGHVGVAIASVIGTTCGVVIENITRQIVEYLFPDGFIEEINAKRLLYHRSLKVLNCPTDANLQQIQKQYRQLALAYHPDKTKSDDASQFHTVVAAFEIVKTYHETLDAACKRLNIPRDQLSKETLSDWDKNGRKLMRPCKEVDLSYEILYRHLNYTKEDLQWLREKLNIHHAANVSDACNKPSLLPPS